MRFRKLIRYFLPAVACMTFLINSGYSQKSEIDAIVGIWEGKKVDGRYDTTEPWGPFEITMKADGSLAAIYLGSRLGFTDTDMYNVTLKNGKFRLQMNRWGGAILEADFSPEEGIVGTLRHHGMVESLSLQKIPNRSDKDIIALLESGEIAQNPSYQSEFMSVLIHEGVEVATRIYRTVRKANPDYQIFGPSAVNSWGYELLNKKKTTEAIDVFKLNVLAYPDDANSYDSLGEGYVRNGDREPAIKALKKSLSMNPAANVKRNSIKLLKELGVDYKNTGT